VYPVLSVARPRGTNTPDQAVAPPQKRAAQLHKMTRHYNPISERKRRFCVGDRFSEQTLPKMGRRLLHTPRNVRGPLEKL
jgi:hypothetical protein